jgi:hypothetical protein
MLKPMPAEYMYITIHEFNKPTMHIVSAVSFDWNVAVTGVRNIS